MGRNLRTLLTAPLAKRSRGTALHEAAKAGNMRLLRLALPSDKGAGHVDKRDSEGRTALYVGAEAGQRIAERVGVIPVLRGGLLLLLVLHRLVKQLRRAARRGLPLLRRL